MGQSTQVAINTSQDVAIVNSISGSLPSATAPLTDPPEHLEFKEVADPRIIDIVGRNELEKIDQLSEPERQKVISELNAVYRSNIAENVLARVKMSEEALKKQIITGLIQEITNPSSIHQSFKATCSPTSDLIELATRAPSEYVRLVKELISSGNEARLKNGEILLLLEDSLDKEMSRSMPNRSISMRLLQDSAMQFALGYERDSKGNLLVEYDQKLDLTKDTVRKASYTGLWDEQAQRLRHALFDEEVIRYDTFGDRRRDSTVIINDIKEEILEKGFCQVKIFLDRSGAHECHWIAIRDFDGEKFSFDNPQTGKTQQSISVGDLEDCLACAFISTGRDGKEARITPETQTYYDAVDLVQDDGSKNTIVILQPPGSINAPVIALLNADNKTSPEGTRSIEKTLRDTSVFGAAQVMSTIRSNPNYREWPEL